jgi:hypothetical protein
VPAVITLSTVEHGPRDRHGTLTATPYGYTVSLLMFLVPVLALGYWHMRKPPTHAHRRSLLWASGFIAALGFLLDLVFGESFFVFRNQGATLGIRLPAWSFRQMSWVPDYLPLEEFAFYVLGGLFMLTLYVWVSANWLHDYDPDEFAQLARQKPKLVKVSGRSVFFWGAWMIAGLAFKRWAGDGGIPGYFLFIMVLGFLPTVLFLRGVSGFVNWRAFAFAYSILLFVELLWEVTLGVPYDWWNYRHEQMLGIRAAAWSNLPLEAALLWLVVGWVCIIAFEVCRVFLHMDGTVKERLIGKRGHRTRAARPDDVLVSPSSVSERT